MSRSMLAGLLCLAVPSILVACAATTDDVPTDDDDASEAAITSGTDVAASFVGRYLPTPGVAVGDIAALTLKNDHHYVLSKGAAGQELGTFTVLKTARAIEMRLTPSKGALRRYTVTLGDGLRPRFTATRSGKVSVLAREPLSCASVNCTPGFACSVEEHDGVPGPVCNAPPPPPLAIWKGPFASANRWGMQLDNAIEAVASGLVYRDKPLWCTITRDTETISCAVTGLDFVDLSARIEANGTFQAVVAGARPSTLTGRVATDGTVTVTGFEELRCVGTYCERFYGANLPKAARPFELCRMPDQIFQSGGWASGYSLDCARCHDQCEGGR